MAAALNEAKPKADFLARKLRSNFDKRIQRMLAPGGYGNAQRLVKRFVDAELDELESTIRSIDDVIEHEITKAIMEVVEVETIGRIQGAISDAVKLNQSSAALDLEEILAWADADGNERITFDELYELISGDGGEILAAVARPSQLTGKPLRVLVVLHEFFGLTESIVGKAQAYADELECLVIAPDTFRGTTTSFIPQAIWLALSTPQQRVNKDLTDVFAWASEQPGVNAARPAVLGFCYGGGKALRFTTQIKPDAATVVFYGNPLTSPEDFAKLRAPVCGIFGTQDPQIPQGLVKKFREALEAANVEHEVMSYYGVGHAFWTDVGQVEREEMPQLAAWRLSTNFLRNHFEGKESFARKRAFLEFMLEEQAAREASDPQAEAPLDPTE